jgi:nickel-dependent lactate racemase
MKTVTIPFGPFGSHTITLELPDETDVLKMGSAPPIVDPAVDVAQALAAPIDSPSLETIVRRSLQANPAASATIVIADHTRPVPYKGEQGILWPIVEKLVACGVHEERIIVLVGTGTHHPLTLEVRRMLDPRVFSSAVRVISHDCRDPDQLRYVGTTGRGTEVLMNRHYLDADIKIATGLVESHFLAGASGGRKAICPGIMGEKTTYSFHSAPMVASSDSRHLKLDGNPHHEESLAIARMAPPDFTINATLDSEYRMTGVYAGELDAAHRAAVEKIKSYVTIDIDEPYDIVLTHGGFVSINHYQAVKPALVALEALTEDGWLYLPVAATDEDPIGSARYRTLLHLLRMTGPEAFTQLVFSPDWTFLPDQWEVQAWAKVDTAVKRDQFIYYSPQCCQADYTILPGTDGNLLLPETDRYVETAANVQRVLDAFVSLARAALFELGVEEPRVAFLYDGPYGIVRRSSAR